MPLHEGSGFILGQRAGEEAHTLISQEMPQHSHIVTASNDPADLGTPVSNFFANAGGNLVYSGTINTTMNAASVSPVGGNQPHENMSPYLVLNFCIALQGIFPSPN
jgi:microcystin-dependent protein